MKVSFLVTYYNQNQYVKKSLDSILAIEKDFEWEILVGDDGSNDNTIDVVKSYIEKYPEKIFLNVMPREEGKKYSSVKRASANRLALLERMTGDAFCILDGDDWYCDNTFVKDAITVLENNKNVSVVAFGFKYVNDNIDGHKVMLPNKFNGKVIETSTYLRNFYIHAGACVYRKISNNDRIAFIKSIEFFDDNDIVINSLNDGNMYSINRVIYAYRQTGISVYTSMNALEQMVLNVQGYDIDVKLIDKKYRNTLLRRNAVPILMMYLYKYDLENIIGAEKHCKYLEECKEIEDSLTFKLLDFKNLSSKDKEQIKQKFYQVMKFKKKVFLKIFYKYVKYKIKSKFV